MTRTSKLTPDITKRIGDNIALGLTYSIAANSAGITYQTFNDWLKKGRNSTSGKYYRFSKHIEKCNAYGAEKLLTRLNDAAKDGNCQVCMWILERRFPEDFARRQYRKMNVVSKNQNDTVEIIVKDVDIIKKKIMDKFFLVAERYESPIV
jgi:hypothetical protein